MPSSKRARRMRRRNESTKRAKVAQKNPWIETESRLEHSLGDAIVGIRDEGEGIVVRAEFFCEVDREVIRERIRRFLRHIGIAFILPYRIEVIESR